MSATLHAPRSHRPSRGTAAPEPPWLPVMRIGATAQQTRPPRRLVPVLAGLTLLAAPAWGILEARSLAAAHEGRVPPGIVVSGEDLSSLTVPQARARLEVLASAELDREVAIVAGDVTTTTTPGQLGAAHDIDDVLAGVRATSESLGLRDWLAIRWLGRDLDVRTAVTYTPVPAAAIDGLLDGIAEQVDRPARDAAMSYDSEGITFVTDLDGRTLDRSAARGLLAEALAVGDRSEAGTDGGATPAGSPVDLPVVVALPSVRSADLGQVLYLDQSEHLLQLHDDGVLVGEWVVATGAAGYPTPTGEFFVEELRENPTWGNPAPNGWGRDLPAFIGPGPSNPLGVRAINWGGTDNIRFHGTTQEWSLGTDASHGCVRMSNDDVTRLFDLVELGTPIISVA